MDNQELLQAISALLEKELGAMRDEMNYNFETVTNRLDKLEAGQESLREEMNRRFDELTLAIGDIVTEVGDMMDDKLSALAHELKWTKDATAQNSMDIAALKKRS